MTPPELVRRVRRGLCWVVFESHIELLEIWTAVNAMLWGLWVANPFSAMFATAPGFATMALLPEWLWGMSALMAGAMQLAGLVYGRPRWRRAGARALASLWMFAAAALAWQNWRWTSSVTYPMLTMASLLVSYRAHTYAQPQSSPPPTSPLRADAGRLTAAEGPHDNTA